MNSPIFPAWTNQIRPLVALALLGGPLYLVTFVSYGMSPRTTDVGYAPIQPVPFSHRLHAGELGLDCRYCHTSVEKADFAAVPPTQTCMNCHARQVEGDPNPKPAIRAVAVSPAGLSGENPRLKPLYDAHEKGLPLAWKKMHDLGDYVYFNHSAHVLAGVSCVSCHGRIDTMDVVHQVEPLNMGWCLDCHRAPEVHLRPQDQVTNLDWKPEGLSADATEAEITRAKIELGTKLRKLHNINPSTDCSTCHR